MATKTIKICDVCKEEVASRLQQITMIRNTSSIDEQANTIT